MKTNLLNELWQCSVTLVHSYTLIETVVRVSINVGKDLFHISVVLPDILY